jgi:hypothetical protein
MSGSAARPFNLPASLSNDTVERVKSVTKRQFLHQPSLTRNLGEGECLVVTSNGSPEFMVTKAGPRRFLSVRQLESEARRIFPKPGSKVDGVEFLRSLRR